MLVELCQHFNKQGPTTMYAESENRTGGATAFTSAFAARDIRTQYITEALPHSPLADINNAQASANNNHGQEVCRTSFLTHCRRLEALASEDVSRPYKAFFGVGATTPESALRKELGHLIDTISTTVSASNKQVGRMLDALLQEIVRSSPDGNAPLTQSERALYVILQASPLASFKNNGTSSSLPSTKNINHNDDTLQQQQAVEKMIAESLQARPLNDTALQLTEGLLAHEWSSEIDPVVYAASCSRGAPSLATHDHAGVDIEEPFGGGCNQPFDCGVRRIFSFNEQSKQPRITSRCIGKKARRTDEDDTSEEGLLGSPPVRELNVDADRMGSWGECASGAAAAPYYSCLPPTPKTPLTNKSSLGPSSAESSPDQTLSKMGKRSPAETVFESFFTALALSADAALVLHVSLRCAAIGTPDPFGFVSESATPIFASPAQRREAGAPPPTSSSPHRLISAPTIRLASEFITSHATMETTRWIMQPVVEYCTVGTVFRRLNMIVDEVASQPEMARRLEGSYGVALVEGLRIALSLYTQSVTGLDVRSTRVTASLSTSTGGSANSEPGRGWSILKTAAVTLGPLKEFILTLQQIFVVRLDNTWSPRESISQLAGAAGMSRVHDCLSRCRCAHAFPFLNALPKEGTERKSLLLRSSLMRGILDVVDHPGTTAALPSVDTLPATATAAAALVQQEALKPFYALMTTWVNRSQLDGDTFGEFFVEKINAPEGGHPIYTLITSANRIPAFCKLDTANAVLTAGTARLALIHCGATLIGETKRRADHQAYAEDAVGSSIQSLRHSSTVRRHNAQHLNAADPLILTMLTTFLEALSGSHPAIGEPPSIASPLGDWKVFFRRCEALLYGVELGDLLEVVGTDQEDDEVLAAGEFDGRSMAGDLGSSVVSASNLGSGWYGVTQTYFHAHGKGGDHHGDFDENDQAAPAAGGDSLMTIDDRTRAMNDRRRETVRQLLLHEHEQSMKRLSYKSELTAWKMRRNRLQRERVIAFYEAQRQITATLINAGIPIGSDDRGGAAAPLQKVDDDDGTAAPSDEKYFVGLVVSPLLPENEEDTSASAVARAARVAAEESSAAARNHQETVDWDHADEALRNVVSTLEDASSEDGSRKVGSLMKGLLLPLTNVAPRAESSATVSPEVSPRFQHLNLACQSPPTVAIDASNHNGPTQQPPSSSSCSSAQSRRSGSKRARSSDPEEDNQHCHNPSNATAQTPSTTTADDPLRVYGINDRSFWEHVGTRTFGTDRFDADRAAMEEFNKREDLLCRGNMEAERILEAAIRTLHITCDGDGDGGGDKSLAAVLRPPPEYTDSKWTLTDANTQMTCTELYKHLTSDMGPGNTVVVQGGKGGPRRAGWERRNGTVVAETDEETEVELPNCVLDPGSHLDSVATYVSNYLSRKALQFLLMSRHCHGRVFTLVNALNKVCLLQDGVVADSLLGTWRAELLLPPALHGGAGNNRFGRSGRSYATHFDARRAFHSFFAAFQSAMAAQPGMGSDSRLAVTLGLGEADDGVPDAEDAMGLLPHITTRLPHLGMDDPLRWILPPQTVDRYGDAFVSLVFWRSVRDLLTEVWRLSMEAKGLGVRGASTTATGRSSSTDGALHPTADLEEVWLFCTYARGTLGLLCEHIWFAVSAEASRLDQLLFAKDGKKYATTRSSLSDLTIDMETFLNDIFVGSLLSPLFSRARRQARTLVRTLEDVVDALRTYIGSARPIQVDTNLGDPQQLHPRRGHRATPAFSVSEVNRVKTRAYIAGKTREFVLSTEVLLNHLEGPLNALSRQGRASAASGGTVVRDDAASKHALRTLETLVRGLQKIVRANSKFGHTASR